MTWYKKELNKQIKEIFSSAIFYILLALSLSVWYFIIGQTFTWIPKDVFSAPSIFERTAYSALTFVTLGFVLYKIRFYQFLYYILGDWRTFKQAKALIWLLLMYFMYAWVVPKFFELLNFIVSIGINLFRFILFIAPPFAISIVIFSLGLYIYKKAKIPN
jgi:hypothetical protein